MRRDVIRILTLALAVGIGSVACAQDRRDVRPREPVVGLPCEDCEAAFEGLPDHIQSRARIAPEDEPGEPMRIEGTVFNAQGQPQPGVIIYAHHTNVDGIYPPDERLRGLVAHRHGRLRGWALTDERGRYQFDTIRPMGYPDSNIPQHVHLNVIEVGRCMYWIDDLVFEDDPRLTPEERQRAPGQGGSGVATPKRDSNGVWVAKRDIMLGKNVPGYLGSDE